MGGRRGGGKKPGPVILECDELWSFVGKKADRYWVWVALDVATGRVLAMFVGDRDESGARGLWDALPASHRASAEFYTDFWEAYAAVLPPGRHHRCAKGSGKTNHVERFFCTLRQRCARVVRKALSFSKKWENHISALWFFVHQYNASL